MSHLYLNEFNILRVKVKISNCRNGCTPKIKFPKWREQCSRTIETWKLTLENGTVGRLTEPEKRVPPHLEVEEHLNFQRRREVISNIASFCFNQWEYTTFTSSSRKTVFAFLREFSELKLFITVPLLHKFIHPFGAKMKIRLRCSSWVGCQMAQCIPEILNFARERGWTKESLHVCKKH